MIRHIVLFSAQKAEDLATIKAGLEILGGIAHCRHFEVAYNSKRDGLSNDIDVVVYAEFDSYDALAAYKAHPLYQESINRVRPLRDQRIAVDFEALPTGAAVPASQQA